MKKKYLNYEILYLKNVNHAYFMITSQCRLTIPGNFGLQGFVKVSRSNENIARYF